MPLEEQVGQLLCCGWQDEGHAHRLIDELRLGGLILFARNVRPAAEMAAVLARFQARAATPLLVGVDQEGGVVARFETPGLVFPGNMALGALGDPMLCAAVGEAIGRQLAAMGVNINFAPVLDVNNNPANPVIGVRSFGDDPQTVAALGMAMQRGLRAGGVLPVVKHFPGHGDTAVDSHHALPVQPADRRRLERVELLPFRAAAGVPALMTAHIRFPALDPNWPATLSPRILTGLLRQEIGFRGLVFTDCLEMAGMANWSPEERGWRALAAGADVLLVSHTWETQRRIAAGVRAAVARGDLPEERVADAARRVADAKRALGLFDPPSEGAGAAAIVGADEFRRLEAEVAARSITVVGGAARLPLAPGARILCCGPALLASSLARSLAAAGWPTTALEWQRGELLPEGWRAAGPADAVIWLALPREPLPDAPARRATLRRLREHPLVIVAAMREPYLLADLTEADVRLAVYSPREPSLQGLAAVLVGQMRPEGRLPVTLSTIH
ncbi:MAG: glycoside hydrolase family 3 protein [Armatimonadetes bacterium]|nr:glycoside hydrolase family 3 protein [Armatimonadota bacterium]